MKRLLRSMHNASNGISHCLRKEKNFRIQVLLGVLCITAGIFFRITLIEWCIIAICIAGVLSLEMINTAIEHMCNMMHPDLHPAIRIIKDVSAGAVFLITLIAIFCGAAIFIPKLLFYISSIQKI